MLSSEKMSHFNEYVGFEQVKFYGEITTFNNTTFKNANFFETKFIGECKFCDAKFNEYASFWGAHFTEKTDFNYARFFNGTTFIDAKFSKSVYFWMALFVGLSDFSNVQFNGVADFMGAQFDGYVTFYYTMSDEAYLFNNVRFNSELTLIKSRFNYIEIEWDSIKDCLVYDGAVYLKLIKNFRSLEQLDDADNCYYRYRRESQSRKNWYNETKGWIHRFDWSKLYDHIAWRSCGYGVRPSFTIACILGFIFGFASLYHVFSGIARSAPPEIAMKLLDKSTLLFTFAFGNADALSFWECLYFSAMALTGRIPEGLHPIGAWKYAVMLESVLGYLFLALFIVVLARKMIR